MDKLTPEQRRKSMQANKSTGTKVELVLAKALYSRELRYRKNNRTILGTPDFSFKKYKVAVFADGDFWHGKDWDKRRNKLGANAGYWFDKIERNIERDYKVNKHLRENGWTVLRFWESDIKKNLDKIADYVAAAIEQRKTEIAHQRATNKEKLIEKYLSNKENSTTHLKNRAVAYTQDLLQEKYHEEFPTKVAEETLKYGVGKGKKNN